MGLIRKMIRYFLRRELKELDSRISKFEPYNPYLQTQVNQVEELTMIQMHQMLDIKRDILALREQIMNLKNK